MIRVMVGALALLLAVIVGAYTSAKAVSVVSVAPLDGVGATMAAAPILAIATTLAIGILTVGGLSQSIRGSRRHRK